MTGWLYLQNYNSMLVAIAGLLTAIGITGMGGAILDSMKIKLTSPWLQPMGMLTGLTVFSISIQILGIFSFSSKNLLLAIWLLFIFGGLTWIYFAKNRIFWSPRLFHSNEQKIGYDGIVITLKIMVFIVASWLLLSSSAPSTRHDEISYHIIIGSRIIQDQSLELYRMPMEATVFPHLFYQIAQAPFHAIGLPDAGGVFSWSILILMCWFLGYMVHVKTGSRLLAILTWFVIVSQPSVINLLITVGPSALAFLSVTMAFFILCEWKSINISYGSNSGLILITVSSITAVSTRLFTLPLSVVFLICAYILLTRERKLRGTDVLLVVTLWLIAFAPIVGWLWSKSGSPLGILTAEVFKSNYFGLEAVSSYNATRQIFTNLFLYRYELALWSVSLWCGVVIYVFVRDRNQFKSIALTLFVFQVLIIIFITPWEIRHLSGLQFALFALGMMSINSLTQNVKSKIITAMIVLTIPWTILSAIFAYSLSKVSLGLEDTGLFLKRNSALFEDYSRIDKILPKNAILLIGRDKTNINQMGWYSRPPIFYAPRRTYSAVADLPNSHNPIFVIYLSPVKLAPAVNSPLSIWLPIGRPRSCYSS